jgi:hypothetical protein
MGRPRKNLAPGDYERLRQLASNGCSHAQIGKALGLAADTLRDRLKDDPAAARAYGEGKSLEEGALVGLLRREADGGNTGAAMFLLKTRHGYNDRGGEAGAAPGVSVTISLPGPLDPATYARLVQGSDSKTIEGTGKAIPEAVDGR